MWDNVKYLLMILVVVGHFAEHYGAGVFKSIFLFIYSFHMPLFIFISGLFYSEKKTAEKVFTYFSLYVLLKAVLFVTKALVLGDASFSLFKEDGIPWFMLVLSAYYGVTFFLRDINTRFLLLFSVILACFAGYDTSIGDYLALSRMIVFYPFFTLGRMIPREFIEKQAKKPKWIVCACIILIGWLGICIFKLDTAYKLRPLFTGRNPYSDSMGYYGILFRLLCYTITCCIGFAFILAASLSTGIHLPGKATMQIYFWHRVILHPLCTFGVMEYLCTKGAAGKLSWLCLGVILTVVLTADIFKWPTEYVINSIKNKPAE